MHTSLLARALLLSLGLSASSLALAQHDHSQHATQAVAPKPAVSDPPATHAGHDGHAQMDHAPAQQDAMDHGSIDHSSMDHAAMGQAQDAHAAPAPPAPAAVDHASMGHAMPADTPREPIPVLTDTDRAAAFPVLQSHGMGHGSSMHSFVLFDRLEAWDADPGTGQAWEAQAWLGGDINRLWLRSAGERSGSRTESSSLEVLYGRSISPWWDVVGGIRHDFTPGDSRSWAALGVQGMAPYKFEVAATAYLGQSGRVAANIEAEYELLLTNRLILQPLVGLEFNSQDDPARHLGSGLSKVETGLRLRYEFTRRFAPYVGVAHERVFGRTAHFHRAEGEGVRDTRVVAGIRFWF